MAAIKITHKDGKSLVELDGKPLTNLSAVGVTVTADASVPIVTLVMSPTDLEIEADDYIEITPPEEVKEHDND